MNKQKPRLLHLDFNMENYLKEDSINCLYYNILLSSVNT